MCAGYLFQPDKQYDVTYDTGDKAIQCGRHVDIFKFWLMWKAKVKWTESHTHMKTYCSLNNLYKCRHRNSHAVASYCFLLMFVPFRAPLGLSSTLTSVWSCLSTCTTRSRTGRGIRWCLMERWVGTIFFLFFQRASSTWRLASLYLCVYMTCV